MSTASTPHDRALQDLKAAEATAKSAGAEFVAAVDTARSAGCSWADIGAALGVSRQAVWERFANGAAVTIKIERIKTS